MKKIITLGLAVFFLLVASCSQNVGLSEEEIAVINEEETYDDLSGTLAIVFTSMKELYENADLVVEGTVTGTETVMLYGFPQTHSTFSIESVLKGNSSIRQVKVMEEGARSSSIGEILPGVPTMEEGQRFLLFLVESGLPQYESNYYIAGAFQGKFIEREGYYFQQATRDVKLPSETYSPMTMKQLTNLLSSWR